jgi:YVTN family beta-propeller protein
MNKNRLLLTALALLILSSAANTVQAVEIVKSIPLNTRAPLAYDSYKGAVWLTTSYTYVNELGMHVSNPTDTISAISDTNYATLANISLGYNPGSIAYDSALHELYVANQASGTISVISDTTNSIVATIDLHISGNGGITGMVYDSGMDEMFVSSSAFGGIFVISDKTQQVVATIPLGNDPYIGSLTYDSGKGEIYVSYHGLPEKNLANFISVISDANNSVIATVPLGINVPFNAPVGPGVYDSTTGEIYFVDSLNSSMLVISDETHTMVDSIQLEPSSFSLGCDPAKGYLFVGTPYNTTYIILDKTKSTLGTVPISCFYMLYDSGKGVMIALSGASSLQFVSDNSLSSISPTQTVSRSPESPTPTAPVSSPSLLATPTAPVSSPSLLATPTAPEFSWLAILSLLVSMLAVALMLKNRQAKKP